MNSHRDPSGKENHQLGGNETLLTSIVPFTIGQNEGIRRSTIRNQSIEDFRPSILCSKLDSVEE